MDKRDCPRHAHTHTHIVLTLICPSFVFHHSRRVRRHNLTTMRTMHSSHSHRHHHHHIRYAMAFDCHLATCQDKPSFVPSFRFNGLSPPHPLPQLLHPSATATHTAKQPRAHGARRLGCDRHNRNVTTTTAAARLRW